jgi:hypothetical protein
VREESPRIRVSGIQTWSGAEAERDGDKRSWVGKNAGCVIFGAGEAAERRDSKTNRREAARHSGGNRFLLAKVSRGPSRARSESGTKKSQKKEVAGFRLYAACGKSATQGRRKARNEKRQRCGFKESAGGGSTGGRKALPFHMEHNDQGKGRSRELTRQATLDRQGGG